MASHDQPRRLALRGGRAVTLRPIADTDGPEIEQAFHRLSPPSRYSRFMHARSELDAAALERGLHPRAGRDFVYVATVPADDGFDIVGAAQYVAVDADTAPNVRGDGVCEFAITVADDWRGTGLASELLASLVRRAARDGHTTIEGWVLSDNHAMLALARRIGFTVEPVPGDATVLCVWCALPRAESTPPTAAR
jgi:RimJ/RimL family protein N-acetyltransferase